MWENSVWAPKTETYLVIFRWHAARDGFQIQLLFLRFNKWMNEWRWYDIDFELIEKSIFILLAVIKFDGN